MNTEEQLSLFAEDSPVSRSPSLGSVEAQKMTAHSGQKCSESYARYSPLGSLVRMLVESSQWNSTQCYLTWKVRANPANRLLFQLVPSMPDTSETGSGLLHTPTATAKLWPTPTATDYKGAPKNRFMGSEKYRGNLREAVRSDHHSGQLNPTWVEWLMGFPIGHTDLSPSETQSFRKSLRQSRKQ